MKTHFFLNIVTNPPILESSCWVRIVSEYIFFSEVSNVFLCVAGCQGKCEVTLNSSLHLLSSWFLPLLSSCGTCTLQFLFLYTTGCRVGWPGSFYSCFGSWLCSDCYTHPPSPPWVTGGERPRDGAKA